MRLSPLTVVALAVTPLAILGFQRQLAPATQVKQLRSLVNVKALTLSLNAYAADADDIYPNVTDLKTLKVVTLPYVKDKTYWKTENPKSEIRFNYAIGGVARSTIPNPKNVVMFYETKPWGDDSRAVSFVDGGARILERHEWRESAMTLLLKDLKRVAAPLPESTGKSWKD